MGSCSCETSVAQDSGSRSSVLSSALLAPPENGKAGLFTGHRARTALKTKEQIRCGKQISFPVRSVPSPVLQQEPFSSCVWINVHSGQLPFPGGAAYFRWLFILTLTVSPPSEHHTPNSKETLLPLGALGATPQACLLSSLPSPLHFQTRQGHGGHLALDGSCSPGRRKEGRR